MTIATTTRVDRDDLDAFLADRRRLVLNTWRSDGRPQMSPVIGALGTDGRLLISSYPTRAKTRNLQRDPDCAVLVLGEDFDDPWVQLYGTAAVLTGEAGVEALVDYYRAAAGEHDDWEEYRQAMRARDKVCIAITITGWGPLATGGLPPEFADS
ncbi:MAG TPA: PPOX class F420-dependent oxidoreductase [Euzebya sp.]|nr:PPOX class F420-dependent oxidoreductase [Euzebya sp.]